ncbi:MAG: guanylate cyclase, partial [Saprospiraceae bacterium]
MAIRQLAAIMFTDMVGYTAMMQENEHLALEKRRWSKTIYDDSLTKHIGTLLQHYGDGTLSINNSGVNAILCAIEMQTQSRQQKIDLR